MECLAADKVPEGLLLTRAAEKLHTVEDFEMFRKATLLSPKLLHPRIAELAWPHVHPRQIRHCGVRGI